MQDLVAFTEPLYETLRAHLLASSAQEEAAFVLGRAVRFEGGHRFVVSEVIPVPLDAFDSRVELGLQISATFANRVLKRAHFEKKGVLLCHSHPFSREEVHFSGVDDWGDGRLLPSFVRHLEQPVGSLVLGQECARARFLDPGGHLGDASRIVITGSGIKIVRPSRRSHRRPSDEAQARQVLAIGSAGQRGLREARVAVVGVGGTGSYVVEFLSRLGFTDYILVDPDAQETSNLSRVANSKPADDGRPKVDVARDAILRIVPGATVRAIKDTATSMAVGVELAAADIVFCCTDNHASRAVLSQVAYEFSLRVLDVGTKIIVRDGEVSRIVGKVVRLGPGFPCLWCSEDISAGRVAEEALPLEERRKLAQEGYVDGMDVKEPAVVTYNAIVAALAVNEVIRDLTGIGASDVPQRLGYDGLSGTVRRVSAPRRAGCVCGVAEARGLESEIPWMRRRERKEVEAPTRPTS